MKFGQIRFWLHADDWKLVPGPFINFIKMAHSETWPFLIVDIHHF